MFTITDPAAVPAPPGGFYSRTRYLTGTPPTSTTVEVSRLFRPEALVEVDLVAAVSG